MGLWHMEGQTYRQGHSTYHAGKTSHSKNAESIHMDLDSLVYNYV